MRFLPLLLLASAACGDPQKTAESCEDSCPLGTAPAESREVSEGLDLDLSFDPATYSGEVAFKRVGTGACELICMTIEPCDEGTFPVITEDCFTCGLVNDQGEIAQGACD